MTGGDGGRFARVMVTTLTSRPLWLALGVANVIAGVVIALRPTQSFDVGTVTAWCRDWLINGTNPYPGVNVRTNYPPYALAMLSPLALVPQHLLQWTWAAASVGLAALAGWLGLRTAPSHGRDHDLRLPVGFFLAWESLRVGLGLGQFTLLALACGLAAVVYQGRIGRGILLGIAMIKPQVGAAFVLWAMLDSAIASVLIAAVPVVVGTIVFAARLGLSPLSIAAQYGAVLRHELGGPGFRRGALELRPLIHDLVAQPVLADTIHLGIVIGSLILMVVVARRMSRACRRFFLLPLTCLWTLMSVYHPSYDLVLIWPAAIAIAAWQADTYPKPMVLGALSTLQLALLVDVPGLWWKLSGRPATYEGGLATAIQHFDRVLVVGIFAALLAVSIRWQPADDAVTFPTRAVPVS